MKRILYLLLPLTIILTYSACKKEEEEKPVVVETIEYKTFANERIAFGGDMQQTVSKTFAMHPKEEDIDKIKMFVHLDCPDGGCNAWDVYANIKVKDTATNEWFEIGRYITPYGVDSRAVPEGFEIDVTDFKSLLHGDVELRARIETWGADGWELTVNFEVTTGKPDYQYYAVSKVMAYDEWSTSGVPYGKDHDKDLTKTIQIPATAKAADFRTIISGWGHATPVDSDGRPCAEWCYRTHHIKLKNTNTFEHYMGPLGCDQNPINNQAGNWEPDRAGWCPGMAVPVRRDSISQDLMGQTIPFEYDYEDWVTDGGNTSGNAGAYYATSCFIVVKSDEKVERAIVMD